MGIPPQPIPRITHSDTYWTSLQKVLEVQGHSEYQVSISDSFASWILWRTQRPATSSASTRGKRTIVSRVLATKTPVLQDFLDIKLHRMK